MKKFIGIAFALATFAGTGTVVANANMPLAKEGRTIARFGVITDIHHTNKPDSTSRKYSAALAKTEHFAKAMTWARADFVIELGDLVDMLAENKDPVQNLTEIERTFTSFAGPTYHVLGNHEFDNVYRHDLLPMLHNTGIATGRTYYSFDKNGIHCVVLDADYTVAEPHRAFDMQDPSNPFWQWQDAFLPQEELDWLEADLAATLQPTVIFSHQMLHRENTEDHTIKNADVVRSILEADGQVIAAFAGHDHRGEIAVRNGIHYFGLEGNVGMSVDWTTLSASNGLHPIHDNPFTLVEIREVKRLAFGKTRTYELKLTGNAQQYSYSDEAQLVLP